MATIEQPVATATGDAAVAGGQPTSEWTRRWKRFLRNRLAVVSLAFIIVVAVVALASPLIAPYGYATIHRGQELLPSFTEGFLMGRSEEHTSELQSRGHLVCRLLLEKKKKKSRQNWRANRVWITNRRREI